MSAPPPRLRSSLSAVRFQIFESDAGGQTYGLPPRSSEVSQRTGHGLWIFDVSSAVRQHSESMKRRKRAPVPLTSADSQGFGNVLRKDIFTHGTVCVCGGD